jgi:serine/threonine protein kinase
MIPYFVMLMIVAILFLGSVSSFCSPSSIRPIVPRSSSFDAVRQEEDGVVLGSKYVLLNDGNNSTSGKAKLVEVAARDTDNKGSSEDNEQERMLVKFSDNIQALKREVKNYRKIASNEEAKDLFVEIHDFFNPSEKNDMAELQEKEGATHVSSNEKQSGGINDTNFDPTKSGIFLDTASLDKIPESATRDSALTANELGKSELDTSLEFKGQAALVMERGTQDLKSFIQQHGPLQGETLRQAVIQTARILKAYHTQKMVWTELKSTNFVIQPQETMESDHPHPQHFTLKAIDLESAVPRGQNPIDYSVEAIPPEFAEAYMFGREPEMEMQKSFDIFSLGLLWYEVATGQQFWHREFFDEHEQCDNVMRIAVGMQGKDKLCLEHASSMMEEPLRELVAACLSVDPDDRPKIDEILVHPYIAELL